MSLLVPQTFWDRLSLLHDSLATGECWNDVDSIAVPIDPPPRTLHSQSPRHSSFIFRSRTARLLSNLCKGALTSWLRTRSVQCKPYRKKANQQGLSSNFTGLTYHYSQLLGKFGPRVCKDNHESTHAILAKLVKSQAGRKIGCLKIQFQSTLALALNKAIQSARACIDNRNLECFVILTG